MSLETIKVELTIIGDADVLVFHLDSEKIPDGLTVNLNNASSQSDLKAVFSKLLETMIESEILLELIIAAGYSKGLYKDVCMEYIQDLNREIKQVYTKLHEETGLELCVNIR